MHVLITGGFGFIGSNLTRYYLQQDHEVTVVDDLSTAADTFQHPKLKFLNIDLSKSELLTPIDLALKDCDLVHHMASAVGVKYIDRDPQTAIRKNNSINHNLFPLFEAHQVKVIFASTSEVYGETEEAKETDVLKIGSPEVLRWGYACGKLMGEFLLKTYTFPHVIARFFNVTGRGQLSEHGMVLPKFIQQIQNNQKLTVFGDGSQFRSFCDIRDAVEMLACLAHNDVHNGQIYNIGNAQEVYSIKELAEMVIHISAKNTGIQFQPFHTDLSSQSQDIIKRRPNTEKINRYYKPQYTLKDTIQEMLK